MGPVKKEFAVSRKWFWAVLIGAVIGLTTALSIRSVLQNPSPPPLSASETALPEDNPALCYAWAFQEGNWDYLIDHTLWIQERLQYEQARTGDTAAGQTTRLDIGKALGDRSEPGNRLRDTGVEDQYVFRPGAAIEVVARDEGRDDLERPTAERIWFRVRFPNMANALFDAAGLAIRAITVGVNVSSEGYILKANVDGNLDVDLDSIEYWDVGSGDR